MGVLKGLWRLLLPVGRRISTETLEGRILAIDASISWLTQFLTVAAERPEEDLRLDGGGGTATKVYLYDYLWDSSEWSANSATMGSVQSLSLMRLHRRSCNGNCRNGGEGRNGNGNSSLVGQWRWWGGGGETAGQMHSSPAIEHNDKSKGRRADCVPSLTSQNVKLQKRQHTPTTTILWPRRLRYRESERRIENNQCFICCWILWVWSHQRCRRVGQ